MRSTRPTFHIIRDIQQYHNRASLRLSQAHEHGNHFEKYVHMRSIN